MTEERIHRAVSVDGTEIAGRVRGEGPPLVLVHGGIGDGEIAWEALWPHLADRYTCYLPSTRGRGLSADSPDHSPPRLEEDVTAFVDSIGEPAGVVCWSGSGTWVLGAAARSACVAAVAAYEPFVTAPWSRWGTRRPMEGSSMRCGSSPRGSAPTKRSEP
jgi:pimeloyl-ACP methyl ester carboxylesterase